MNANGITNIAGTLAGGPQIVLGITLVQDHATLAEGIAKIAEGVGIFIMAYFVGRPHDPSFDKKD